MTALDTTTIDHIIATKVIVAIVSSVDTATLLHVALLYASSLLPLSTKAPVTDAAVLRLVSLFSIVFAITCQIIFGSLRHNGRCCLPIFCFGLFIEYSICHSFHPFPQCNRFYQLPPLHWRFGWKVMLIFVLFSSYFVHNCFDDTQNTRFKGSMVFTSNLSQPIPWSVARVELCGVLRVLLTSPYFFSTF